MVLICYLCDSASGKNFLVAQSKFTWFINNVGEGRIVYD